MGRVLARPADAPLAAVAAALLTFMALSLVSDPLMVREVSYVFWMLLGLGVGHAATLPGPAPARPSPTAGRLRLAIALCLVVAIAGSVPFRAAREIRDADLTPVTYGLSDWIMDDDGTPSRWSGPRATLFVDGRARIVELPLASTFLDGRTQQVEVRVDGRLADRLTVGPRWYRLRLTFPEASPSARRIDLHVSPTWVPAEVIHNDDYRTLGVKVGPVALVPLPPR